MTDTQIPSTRSLLGTLDRRRLVELGRALGVSIPSDGKKDAQVDALLTSRQVHFQGLLEWMGRDELRLACKAHGLDDAGRARVELAKRLLQAHGGGDSVPPKPLFRAHQVPDGVPAPGLVVAVRQRQYLVEATHAPVNEGDLTRVALVCLDDDAQGERLEVLWELELGARVLPGETGQLGEFRSMDPARRFMAYWHALKWSGVTATDPERLQSPFRAGIKLYDHQITPLKKALELPRANLFIADDVGIGKTIEAGLVIQELGLRQRVSFVLIVCPAAICLQWKAEMEKRFGLSFEIYNREYVARRQKERGFGVNPWTTHQRFLISYQTLRRPEYREPLLTHLGARAKKSLLVLDEAHTVAPATASKYAVDSRTTHMARDLAPRFENRLFLSATPHNGHSNSFSALMEILDPQRFTRGLPIEAESAALRSVMVRRLKRDMREAGIATDFPVRRVVKVSCQRESGNWQAHYTGGASEAAPVALGQGSDVELQLSKLLARYTALMRPEKGPGKLVFINLQKRLLSSVNAFSRTLEAHARGLLQREEAAPEQRGLSFDTEDDVYGPDDDLLEQAAESEALQATRSLPSPAAEASALLSEMLELAQAHRNAPDAKVMALLAWIQEHQCPGVRVGGAKGKGAELAWGPRRLLIFTEYGDTKDYLKRLLNDAVEATREGDERVRTFQGAMGDAQREEVQRAFNGDLDEHPVRILIATDAAREGLNLQNHCADLFHFDIPWNPARMEQRNGRIDRTLQPQKEVRCHYFVYPERAEDMVLDALVHKVDRIQDELGSLGDVVMERLARTLEADGISSQTEVALARAAELGPAREVTARELESQRKRHAALRAEVDSAASALNKSRERLELSPLLLKELVDVGLELASGQTLSALGDVEGQPAYALPALTPSWTETLDSLRRPRRRDEPLWEWRKEPVQPVVFQPLDRMGEERVHLHLSHPFVQRIVARFLAQGFSAHDLSRVTVVRSDQDSIARVIVFGRLTLFGAGATRLHDELVSVSARWLEAKGEGHLKPFADEADSRTLERFSGLLRDSAALPKVSAAVEQKLLANAASDFASLWRAVREEADAKAHEASRMLQDRGASEAESMRHLLDSQRAGILAELERRTQLSFTFEEREAQQAAQYADEKRSMEQRLAAIDREGECEPADIQALYNIALKRLEPVGLVYLWPSSRA